MRSIEDIISILDKIITGEEEALYRDVALYIVYPLSWEYSFKKNNKKILHGINYFQRNREWNGHSHYYRPLTTTNVSKVVTCMEDYCNNIIRYVVRINLMSWIMKFIE